MPSPELEVIVSMLLIPEIWLSSLSVTSVSVVSTRTGRVTHTIRVGSNPHGLTLFPQPGRFSIGHNGVYR